MKFIDKIKFKLSGRGIRTLNVEEVNDDGQILVLRDKGRIKRNANTLMETWDQKAAIISSKTRPIEYIGEDGLKEPAFITFKGHTANILQCLEEPVTPETTKIFLDLANLEEVQGKMMCIDIWAELFDLQKDMKHIILGIIFGTPIGFFLCQVISAFAR